MGTAVYQNCNPSGQQKQSGAERQIELQTKIGGDLVFVHSECQVAFFLRLPGCREKTAGIHITVPGVVGQKFQTVLTLNIAGGDFQGIAGGPGGDYWIQHKFIGGIFYNHTGEKAVIVIKDRSVFIH